MIHLHLDVLQLHRGCGGIRGEEEHRERSQSGYHQGDRGEEAENRLCAVEAGVHCVDGCGVSLVCCGGMKPAGRVWVLSIRVSQLYKCQCRVSLARLVHLLYNILDVTIKYLTCQDGRSRLLLLRSVTIYLPTVSTLPN